MAMQANSWATDYMAVVVAIVSIYSMARMKYRGKNYAHRPSALRSRILGRSGIRESRAKKL
jgi:hypothetical protein